MMGLRPPPVAVVRAVVVASIVLTAFHFTDNFVAYDTYTPSDLVTPAVVLISWPLFTALGVAGYLYYGRGRFAQAHLFLLAYSYTGLSSLGHFLSKAPADFTTRGLVSILIDGVAGSAVLAVTVWSIVARSRPPVVGRERGSAQAASE
jgi:hypothetical protein